MLPPRGAVIHQQGVVCRPCIIDDGDGAERVSIHVRRQDDVQVAKPDELAMVLRHGLQCLRIPLR